jgi:hypothetical protein
MNENTITTSTLPKATSKEWLFKVLTSLRENADGMKLVENYFQVRHKSGFVAWFNNGASEDAKMNELKLIARCIREEDYELLNDAIDEAANTREDEDIREAVPTKEITLEEFVKQAPELVTPPAAKLPDAKLRILTPTIAADPAAALLNALKAFMPQQEVSPVINEAEIVALVKKTMAEFLTKFIATINA